MHVERLADDEQVIRNSEGFRVATAAEDKLWMQAYFTRDELRELLPHLAAWAETGSMEADPPCCLEESDELVSCCNPDCDWFGAGYELLGGVCPNCGREVEADDADERAAEV